MVLIDRVLAVHEIIEVETLSGVRQHISALSVCPVSPGQQRLLGKMKSLEARAKQRLAGIQRDRSAFVEGNKGD